MAIRDLKITPEQIARKGVIASPDTLTGTPDENKNVFDRLAREIIVPSVNGAIEMLGQVEDDTVQWESDEQARKLAEQERVSAEKGRAAAEQTRVQAEQERANADGLRTTAEEKRVAAEQARSIAEQERVHAENSRVAAEQEREVAEQGRKAAEEARAQTERDRMLWETYSAIKNYVPGNKVEHGGSSYVNIAPCTGIAPPNSAHWQLVAARGKDGDGAGDMIKAVYDPTGKEQDIFAYSVPQTRTINKKPLSADVTLTGEDIKVTGSDETTIHTRLSEITNPNLLDNWYFGNPVNQRAASEYSGSWSYCIDRWVAEGIITVGKEGVSASSRDASNPAYFLQRFEHFPDGRQVTFSLLTANKLYAITGVKNGEMGFSKTFDDGVILSVEHGTPVYAAVSFPPGKTYQMIATKLEFGSQQTLAHQENGKWVLNEIPDYGEQLQRCQRYFRRFPANYMIGGFQNNTTAVFRYPCTPPMRTTPALVLQDASDLTNALDDGTSPLTPASVVLNWLSNPETIGFYFTGTTQNTCCLCNRYVDVSADL